MSNRGLTLKHVKSLESCNTVKVWSVKFLPYSKAQDYLQRLFSDHVNQVYWSCKFGCLDLYIVDDYLVVLFAIVYRLFTRITLDQEVD
jgi:hypothetical protein